MYIVEATDVNSCQATQNISLANPSVISFTLNQTNPTSGGASNGTINAIGISGGTPYTVGAPYTYSWTGPLGFTDPGTQDLTGLSTTGSYILTMTDSLGCTRAIGSFINDPACAVVITETTTLQPACFGDQGDWQWINSGGLAPYTNVITDPVGSVVASFTAPAVGNVFLDSDPTNVLGYTIKVIDAAGCQEQATASINAVSAIIVNHTAATDITQPLCFGDNDGAATIHISGGSLGIGTPSLPYDINWNDPDGQSTPTATNLLAGNYNVTVEDAQGCLASTPVTGITFVSVPQPLALAVTVTSTAETCFGLANGTATAAVTNGTPDPLLPFGYTYVWNNGDSGPTTSPTLSVGGVYSVTITDANGCTEIEANITIPAVAATLTASTTTSDYNSWGVSCFGYCDGSAFSMPSGGTPPYSYLWSNGQSTQTAINLIANTLAVPSYNVLVTDSNGCKTTASAIITTPDALVLTPTITDASCNGLSDGGATLLGGVAGGTPFIGSIFQYEWHDLSTNIDYTGLSASSSYDVEVTDANNCTATALITINEPATLTLAANELVSATCNGGANGSAEAIASGGPDPITGYDYEWFDNLGASILLQSSSISTATALSAVTYNVTVTDASGTCPPVTHSVTINEPNPILANLSVVPVNCFGGSDGEASVSPTGGTPYTQAGVDPYTYSWTTGILDIDSNVIGLDATTPYFVTITDSLGCTHNPLAISIPQPIAALSATLNLTHVSCFGESDGIAAVTAEGGTETAGYLYNFLEDGTTIIAETGLDSADNYSYLITDDNNCQLTVPVTITEPTEIFFNAQVTDVSCFGDGSITLNPTGGSGAPYDVTWWDPAISGNTASDIAAGTYTITIKDLPGVCTKDTTIIINAPSALDVSNTDSTRVKCNGLSNGTATVIPTGGTPFPGPLYHYEWFDQGTGLALFPAQTAITAIGLAAGTYDVVVTDSYNCTQTASVTVTEPDPISATSSSDTVDCFVGTGINDNGIAAVIASGGTQYTEAGVDPYTYAWAVSGLPTNPITNQSPGTYFVNIEDSLGCKLLSVAVDVLQPDVISVNIDPFDYNGYDVSCFGANDAQITVTATGGSGSYLYSAELPNGVFIGGSSQNYFDEVLFPGVSFAAADPLAAPPLDELFCMD